MFYTINIVFLYFSKDLYTFLFASGIIFSTFMMIKKKVRNIVSNFADILFQDADPELICKECEYKIMHLVEIWNVKNQKKEGSEYTKILKKIKQRVDKK